MFAAPAAKPADRRDALLWLFGLLLLALVPIGRVSGDGLGYARSFLNGDWHWNPNHLLFEPTGAAWLWLLGRMGCSRPAVDQLKLLSIGAGALGAGLFRWSVAGRLAPGRRSANYATAAFVLGAAYLHLLVDDESHMIQMPFLVAFAAAVLRCLERPSLLRAITAGALAGGAALCFVSNVLLGGLAGVALIGWHLFRGEGRAAVRMGAGILAGLLLVTGSVLIPTWALVRPGRPLHAWLLGYAGGEMPARLGRVYGIHWTAGGVVEAAGRAVYGAASAAVDLAPAVAAVRDVGAMGRGGLIALVWLLGAAALGGGLWSAWRRRDHRVLLLQAIWWPAVLGFGLFWNNSEDQFYLPLAVAFGALAAGLPALPRGARGLLLCGAAALAWNTGDLLARYVLYPRAEWTAALLREVRGACLVVAPGWDDASRLLDLAGRQVPADQVTLTDLAARLPADRGLPRLAAALERCRAAGGRSDLVEIFDTPPRQFPWKFLRELGYERAAVERTIGALGVDPRPRSAGPFRVRSIRPSPKSAISNPSLGKTPGSSVQ
ncbi:MAG TPA: hypothetical protein VOA87_06845 [Thermoanaerobaculia bacterium]|nr:hypothetical protein [Thermoanaerobaculia bacterium]